MRRLPPHAPVRNREGLTFLEWIRAANFGRRYPLHGESRVHRFLEQANDPKLVAAWRRGEDPTEYAGHESPERTREKENPTFSEGAALALCGLAAAGALAYFLWPKPASGAGNGKTVTITSIDNGKTVNLNVGDTLKVLLPKGNAQVPWTWKVQIVGQGTLAPGPSASDTLTETYSYAATGPGTVAVTIQSVGAFATGALPLASITVNIFKP
jgi:hypothetical protein